MFEDRTIQDLAALTAIKLAVIAIIYYACFAAYDGRKLDTAAHLLGPAPVGPQDKSTDHRGS